MHSLYQPYASETCLCIATSFSCLSMMCRDDYAWEAWLLFRPAEDIHVAAFMLHGGCCYEPVGLLLPNGELRPQHYSSVFGPEVNEGAVLVIKKVKPVHNPAAQSSTPQLVAATHCVVATLAATFQPGFMIIMPEAWDWGVAQIPGTAFHCMHAFEVCISSVCAAYPAAIHAPGCHSD